MNPVPNPIRLTRSKQVVLNVFALFMLGATELCAKEIRISQIRLDSPNQVTITYDSELGGPYTLLQGNSVTNVTTHVATNSGVAGPAFFVQTIASTTHESYFRIAGMPAPPPTTLTSSPANGEGDVSVNRETILRFSNPLSSDTTISNDTFFASYGGRKILSRIELSSDQKTATLFYLEPVPASARIRVQFRGDSVLDFLGRAVDADGDGLPGGTAQIDYDTLSITPVGRTAVIGRVFASELMPDPKGTTNTINKPLAGVTITVDGAEQTLRAVTDSLGNFRLQPCPAGQFFVHIDGRTSPLSQWPNGSFYPFVGKEWEAAAGRDNLAGGTGEIFLPFIIVGTLQTVSATSDTKITFPSMVIANNPALAGVSVTVPANALFSDNGTRGGKVGIAPVSPDRLPGPLPPGLEFPLVITVQTDGGLNFDRPAPVCFPNLPDPGTGKPLAPGEKNYLFSFNHKKGEWEAIGSMTVSADGKFICTDPGVGIVQPGWHGSGPPPVGPGECPPRGAVGPVCCLAPQPPGPSPVGPTSTLSKSAFHSFSNSHNTFAQLDRPNEMANECPPCKPNPFAYNLCVGTATAGYVALVAGCYSAFVGCTGGSGGIALPGCFLIATACLTAADSAFVYALYKCKESYDCLNRGLALPDGPPALLDDPIAEGIRLNLRRAIDLLAPYQHGEIVPDSVRDQLLKLVTEANAIAGGDAFAYMYDYALRLERQSAEFIDDTIGLSGNAPAYPVFYVAEIRRPTGLYYLRGETLPFGNYSLFIPRDGTISSVSFYDPKSKSFGVIRPYLRPEAPHRLPRFTLFTVDKSSPDSDADGLPDAVELVYGSDPINRDSDGDGIKDGAEIDNGTNPLDGLAVATGVIASADTPGTAVDICAINNMAVVADSEAGISVFNVLAGLNPVRVAQIDTPGIALAASCSGNLIAVADGGAGLQIVDISDPPAARIVRNVGINALGGGLAQAVASAANLAFVGTTQGTVSMVEIDTGVLLQRIDLGADFPVSDLAVEGTTLYAYAGSKLFVLPFRLGPMERHGSVTVPTGGLNFGVGRMRLFVGNNIAYPVVSSGYRTIDVSNPDAPKLIAGGNTTQLGWVQIVPNGSGTALAVRGVNPRLDATSDVSLYDVSDPKKNDVFLTTFSTPGFARAASIYNGIGYVADHANGMQVVNYLAYDNKGRPPTGVLKTSSTDGTITGGAFLVLRAEVNDDVQVRNVEFYVDGTRIAIDGNFPFETVYRVPKNVTGNKLTFSVNIFDTGGNPASVTNIPLSVVPDNQPPGISIDSPADGQTFFLLDDVPIKVTAIDNSGIDSVTFKLNGKSVPVRRTSFFEWQIDLPELPTGTNTLTATATDLAGLSTTSKPVRFVVLKEAISREVSVFNFGPKDVPEAISREVSTFNFGPPDKPEAISREVSTFNFGPVDKPEAISREVSVKNQKPAQAAAAAAAREERLRARSK